MVSEALQPVLRELDSSNAVYLMERIPKMPISLSQSLLRKHVPGHPDKEIVMARLYLGKDLATPIRFFNPWNFPINAQTYQELVSTGDSAADLPTTESVAFEMGCKLSNIHDAGFDARDVEFVLAGSSHSESINNWGFYVIDFNQMRPFPANNGECASLLSQAFFLNDPYYPRPEQSKLYECFKWGYRQATTRVDLAEAFFSEIERHYANKSINQNLTPIQFNNDTPQHLS